MSIELTGDQLRAAATNPVRITDPETRRDYVVLPAEVYDRLQALAAEDPLNTREVHPETAVGSYEEWSKALHEWAVSHQGLPNSADWSRERIYAGRRE